MREVKVKNIEDYCHIIVRVTNEMVMRKDAENGPTPQQYQVNRIRCKKAKTRYEGTDDKQYRFDKMMKVQLTDGIPAWGVITCEEHQLEEAMALLKDALTKKTLSDLAFLQLVAGKLDNDPVISKFSRDDW